MPLLLINWLHPLLDDGGCQDCARVDGGGVCSALTWPLVVHCSKKVLLLKNLQSYDKMATYRVAGWFGLLCRSIDSSTLIAYPSPFMRQSVAVTLSVMLALFAFSLLHLTCGIAKRYA